MAMRLGMGKGIPGTPDIAPQANIALALSAAAAVTGGAAVGARAGVPARITRHCL
jgi:hypothetical protein